METIGVGIIGAGGIAQYGHLPAYQKIPGVEVAAVADINEKKSAYVAERFGIPQRFVDYREMLERPISMRSVSALPTTCIGR